MASISIETSKLPSVRAKIKKINAKLKNSKATHSKISIMLDQWVQKNFRSEGGKVGGWKKLQADGRYVGTGRNRKFDSSAKILRDTGRLALSFIPFATQRNAGIGSELPYAKSHNEGEGVPKRRILMQLPEVRDDIIKRFDAHVKESIK